MLELVTVYVTSKGNFLSKWEAELKVNRQKDTDPRSQNFGNREPVVEKLVLCDIIDGKLKFFNLSEIKVLR